MKFRYLTSLNKNPKHTTLHMGFTLIELMVTISILGIMAAIAFPMYQDILVKSKFSSIGNEFIGSILSSRNHAVNKNTCVSMCMSVNPDAVNPSCTDTGLDWQAGWITFLNPTCNSALTAPATAPDLISVRRTVGTDYFLYTQAGGEVRSMMFNSLGSPGGGANGRFDIVYIDNSNTYTDKYAFSICVDIAGRARPYKSQVSCN